MPQSETELGWEWNWDCDWVCHGFCCCSC